MNHYSKGIDIHSNSNSKGKGKDSQSNEKSKHLSKEYDKAINMNTKTKGNNKSLDILNSFVVSDYLKDRFIGLSFTSGQCAHSMHNFKFDNIAKIYEE